MHLPLFGIKAYAIGIMLLAGACIAPHNALSQKKTGGIPAASGSLQQRIPHVMLDSLPNGMRIMFTRVNDLPLAEINVIVDAGIALEQSDEHGAAYCVSQLLMAGNKDRTGEMIGNYIAELGSVIIPYVHYDYAQLYAKTLTKNFSATLGLLAGSVTSPVFPQQALQLLQRDASVRLHRNISSGERATMTAIQGLCGAGSAISRPLQPAPEEVQSLSIESVRKYHASWYHPRRTTVIITGNLDYDFVKTALREAFGKWTNGEEGAMPAPGEVTSGPSVTVLADSATHSGLAYFRIGGRGVLRNDEDFASLMILSDIFGGSPQSMLRRALWSEHMLSPNFSSAIAFSRDCSYFMISGSASPMLTDSVLLRIRETIERLTREGVSVAELSDARQRMLADEALTFASNRSLQSLLKEAVVYGIPVDRAFRFAESIRAVDNEDILRISRKVFAPENRQTVILGAAEKIVPLIQGMGTEVRVVE